MQDRDIVAMHIVNGLLVAKIKGLGWEYIDDILCSNPKMLAKVVYNIADELFKQSEIKDKKEPVKDCGQEPDFPGS